MKNRIFITALLGAGALLASGADICVGSYNIRVLTPNDRGVHNWDARKEYVARTVTDNGMDVVGFNEVKSERQQTELRNLLPGYSFSGWDGHENSDITNETAVDLIGWRSEKFTLLDEGYYFLCRTPEKWESSWDNSDVNNVRHTSWVKLRENATGEDFYFFCCHLDHQGQLARMLQAHMNHALIKRIAGTAPHILVGDQNSTTSRVNYLNIFNANFDDAFTVTNASERYGADPATAGQWNDDPTAGRRIDYIWSDGFDVLSYDHCTDMYDLGAMPSDHIAIKATVRMQMPVRTDKRVYVSAGNSGGDGTLDAPFGTIEEAVGAALRGDTIMVAAGDYEISKSITVTKSVKLFGGYDETFGEIAGQSNVRATADVRCFSLKAGTDVEMRHFGIYNGRLTADTGDGAGVMAHGARFIARYCEFADNSAARDGGAIDATGQLILDHVRFLRNSAGRYGGAFCADNPSKRYWFNMPVTNCHFEENRATDGSAGYLPRFIHSHISGNTFTGNEATAGSTLYLHAIGTGNNLGSKLSVFNNTFILNKAAGADGYSAFVADIEPDGAVGVVCNTIVSNEGATAAMGITSGKPYIAGNIIACNRGGDVRLAATSGIAASHNVYTTAGSISHSVSAYDLVWNSEGEAAVALAGMLDGDMEGDRFVPVLSRGDAGADPEAHGEFCAAPTLHDYVAVLPDELAELYAPATVEVIDNTCGTYSLSCLPQNRLREATIHTDFNFDCMEDAYLLTDQRGEARPQDGTATIGATEYAATDGVERVGVGSAEDDFAGETEYYSLQGMRLGAPAAGTVVIIRRAGGVVEKVVIR